MIAERPQRRMCKCGCICYVNPGKTFIRGHYARVMSNDDRKKISKGNSGKKRTSLHKKRCSEAMLDRLKYNDHPMLGHKHSEETKKKMSKRKTGKRLSRKHKDKISESHVGKKLSKETKRKIAEAKMGEKHPNWRGGISLNGYCGIFYTKEFRDLINERDGDICHNPLCHKKDGLLLHFHHINYDKSDCNPNNIIKICSSCNLRANHSREFWQRHYEKIMEDK